MGIDSLSPADRPARDRRFELALVAAIWIAASLLIYLLAKGNVTPRRFIDEFLYWNIAGNFSRGDGFSWNGSPVALKSWLYPVLIAPAFRLTSGVASQYQLVQFFNAVFISAVVFPAHQMARQFVGRGLALFAALLAIAVPAMNYAGIIGTESLAYLTCTAAFAGSLYALARPGVRSCGFALLFIAVAVLTRTQFLILVPILLVSLLLVALMRPRAERKSYLREQRLLLGVLGGSFALAAAYLAISGRSSVGIYVQIFDGARITAGNLWFWIRGFASDVFLLTGILPTIATFALLGSRENRRDPLISALVALALVASVSFVLQMSWFSAINTFKWREMHVFYERYMFYLGPIFFTGLVAALGRVSTRAVVVSTVVAVLLVGLTPPDIISIPYSIDAFGQAYLGFILDQRDSLLPLVGPLLAGLTAVLGALLALSTVDDRHADLKKWGRILALGAPLFLLVLTQAKAWTYSSLYSESALTLQPKPLNFVETATRERTGQLVAEGSDPSTYYATAFWNPRVDRFFVSAREPVSSPIVYGPNCKFDWSPDGRVLPTPVAGTGCGFTPAGWLIQSNTFSMRLRDESARVSAKGGVASTVTVGARPVRIFSMAGGRSVRDGRVSEAFVLRSFLDAPGELRVRVETQARGVSLALPGDESVKMIPGEPRTITLPVQARDHLTRISVVTEAGLPRGTVKFAQVRLREGRGPWRNAS